MAAVAGSLLGIAAGFFGAYLMFFFFGVLTLTTIKAIVTTSGLRDPWWQTITTGAMLCFFILLQSVVLSNRGKFKLSDLFRKKKTDVILEKN